MEILKKTNEDVRISDSEISEEEMKLSNDFLDCDLSKSQDFHVIHNNKDYSEAEAFVLYPDYMMLRHKSTNKEKKHCETMAMDVDHETNIDVTETIIRESISSIVMFRQQSCTCDKCLTEIAKGVNEAQSDGYIIEIGSSRRHLLFAGDKDYASFLQVLLMEWRLKKGPFKHKDGVFYKPKSKLK